MKLFKERLLHWHYSSIPGLAFYNQKKYLGQLQGKRYDSLHKAPILVKAYVVTK
jgi:hypothetical protein